MPGAVQIAPYAIDAPLTEQLYLLVLGRFSSRRQPHTYMVRCNGSDIDCSQAVENSAWRGVPKSESDLLPPVLFVNARRRRGRLVENISLGSAETAVQPSVRGAAETDTIRVLFGSVKLMTDASQVMSWAERFPIDF